MSGRRYKYTPAPVTAPAPTRCIYIGCEDDALSFALTCETHYDDKARRARGDEERRYWAGLNVRPTFIYFVQAEGPEQFIKVGRSRNGLEQRLSDARTFCPYDIALLACVWSETWVEKALRARFAPHRHRGEWFYPDTDVLEGARLANISARALESFARPHAVLVKNPPKDSQVEPVRRRRRRA